MTTERDLGKLDALLDETTADRPGRCRLGYTRDQLGLRDLARLELPAGGAGLVNAWKRYAGVGLGTRGLSAHAADPAMLAEAIDDVALILHYSAS